MAKVTDKITRRTFARRVAVVSAATQLMSPAHGIQPTTDHDIGRRIYKSLKWNMVKFDGSMRDKFAVLKELGFDGVELPCPGDLDAREAVAASKAVGLPIEGIVDSTHWKIRHSDPDPAIRRQALANLEVAIRFAQEVGAQSVLLVPGKVTDALRENHDHVWRRSIADIRAMLPLAEKLQVDILIENVGNGFCETPQLFAQYIDEISHPQVGIHFDIGNHIQFSPPADWIRHLNKRIKKLDVKDRTKANKRTLVGEGDADWPQVRASLQEIGYKGWAAAEVPGGDKTRLADVLHRMNTVLGKSDANPGSL